MRCNIGRWFEFRTLHAPRVYLRVCRLVLMWWRRGGLECLWLAKEKDRCEP